MEPARYPTIDTPEARRFADEAASFYFRNADAGNYNTESTLDMMAQFEGQAVQQHWEACKNFVRRYW